jgi:hypothetical protein
MGTRTALFFLGPAGKGALEVRQVPRRHPAADESRSHMLTIKTRSGTRLQRACRRRCDAIVLGNDCELAGEVGRHS